MRNSISILAAAALMAMPVAATAQSSATLTATANVLAPVTVTAPQGLLFDGVLPGVAETVDPNDGTNAGQFVISGNDGSEVELDFGTLPTTLAGPGDPLAISFGAGSAGWGTSGSLTLFDPEAASITTTLTGGALDVFIGGTVDPAFDQAAGAYTGTITLTVTYTGS